MKTSADITNKSYRRRLQNRRTRQLPIRAVVVGIVAGAGLGVGLAQGILGVVYEQRELHRRKQEANADAVATEQLMNEREQLRSTRENSDWFRWATEKRSP